MECIGHFMSNLDISKVQIDFETDLTNIPDREACSREYQNETGFAIFCKILPTSALFLRKNLKCYVMN